MKAEEREREKIISSRLFSWLQIYTRKSREIEKSSLTYTKRRELKQSCVFFMFLFIFFCVPNNGCMGKKGKEEQKNLLKWWQWPICIRTRVLRKSQAERGIRDTHKDSLPIYHFCQLAFGEHKLHHEGIRG